MAGEEVPNDAPDRAADARPVGRILDEETGARTKAGRSGLDTVREENASELPTTLDGVVARTGSDVSMYCSYSEG
jgi:hypothetical protein